MSRYLVTGGTGFLGQHLVTQLRAEGHDVVLLCRTASPAPDDRGVIVRRGDVLDAASVADAAAGCDGVFHCAGRVSRNHHDAEAMYRVHVDGTKATLGACRDAGVPRAVLASTSGVVAISTDPDDIRDEDAPTPTEAISRWPYYRSKLYAERAAFDRATDDFAVISVNPSLLLGPGDERGSSTEDVRKFLEKKVPFVPGGGVAFVDVRDAAAALVLAMKRGASGRRYLVNAANMTLEAFFGRLSRIADVPMPSLRLPRTGATLAGVGADLLGRAAKALHMPEPVDRVSAEMAQYFWYTDASRAERELGWTHRDPGDTLADTIDDLRARGVVWPAS